MRSLDQAGELRLRLGERAIMRSELMLGLNRMDSGLPFESQGLRGGGFPHTPQAAALTHEVMRLQVKDIYPDFTNAQADELLRTAGTGAQALLDGLKLQLQQLRSDLRFWVEQTLLDVDDMYLDFLALGDEDAAGMNAQQVAAHNVEMLQHVIDYERQTRNELADELIAMNAFLESFPNLRSLNLQHVDLRRLNANDVLEAVLPSPILRMNRLETLNLNATFLAFEEETAGQLCDLLSLQTLDLSDNPLAVPPVVLGLNQLRVLNLRNTGIARCPVGIANDPYLTSLDLRDNRISRVSEATLNQAIAKDRIRLWGNPLTDEETLTRLVDHRERTGINLWLSQPDADYGSAIPWLEEGDEMLRTARRDIWQRLLAKPSGGAFLRVMDGLSLTADFRVGYWLLQARVWRLLREADASEELWAWLRQCLETTLADAENPFVLFTVLEDRVRLYSNWVAMGRPNLPGEHPVL